MDIPEDVMKEVLSSFAYRLISLRNGLERDRKLFYTWRCLTDSCDIVEDPNYDYLWDKFVIKCDEIDSLIEKTEEDLDPETFWENRKIILEKLDFIIGFCSNFDSYTDEGFKAFLKEFKKKKT